MILRQVPHEGPGLIADVLDGAGIPYKELLLYSGDELPVELPSSSALIVMGGPMGVDDFDEYPFLSGEVELIKKAFESNVPVLGICLGAQLMAKALGAAVYKGDKKEIGFYDVTLTNEALDGPFFSGFPESMKVLQWHGDTFDLPKGAELVARSPLFPNQGFTYKNSLALQFHFETTLSMLTEWLGMDENLEEIGALGGGSSVEGIERDAHDLIEEINGEGLKVLGNFFSNG